MADADRPIGERIAEFFRRLESAAPASDLEFAIRLMNDLLDGVEDEMTSIPNVPTDPRFGDRMKGIDPARFRDVQGHPNVRRQRHTHHETFLGVNGAIEIRYVKTGQVQFQKSGADGRGVWSLDI